MLNTQFHLAKPAPKPIFGAQSDSPHFAQSTQEEISPRDLFTPNTNTQGYNQLNSTQ